MPYGEDPAVEAMQPPHGKSQIDAVLCEPQEAQLPPSYYAVLGLGKRRDPGVHSTRLRFAAV